MGYTLRSWLLLCSILLFSQTKVIGQYSQATQEVLNVSIFLSYHPPTEGLSREQIQKAVKETTGADGFISRFLNASFHNSMESDSTLIYFAEAKDYAKKIGIGYDTIGMIDYTIAKKNANEGKLRIAELYLKKIINKTSESDYIYWLARIEKARIFPNKREIRFLEKIFEKGFDKINDNFKGHLIIRFLTVLQKKEKLNFYRKYATSVRNLKDPVTTFTFFNANIFNVIGFSGNRVEIVETINIAKEAYNKIKNKNKYFDSRYQKILLEEYSLEGNYYKANKVASLACIGLGIDTSLNFQISAAGIALPNVISTLSSFAMTKLYLGPYGIRQAFEIFYRLADQYLISETKSLTGWDVAGKHRYSNNYMVPKVLYIASYIYAETGDRSYLNRALALVDATRGATLYSQLFRRDAIRNGGGLSELLKMDLELSRKEYSLSQEEEDGTLLDRMIETQQERQRVMADIAARYPDYLEQRSILSPDFIGEQQAHLAKSGGSMIYFLHHSNFSFRILINADSVQADNLYHRVLDKNDLPQLMASYPDCVNQSPGIDGKFSAECKTDGYALYQRLFGDIEDQLKEKVLIIGDGPFTNFPFSSLPTDDECTDYMGTRHSITYNVSARLQRMTEDQRVNPKHHEILAFSPSSGNSTFALERGRETMGGLRNTGAELDAIEAILPGSYFRGADATRENLLEEIGNYEVIHLASHASADPNDGRMSYLVLNREKDDVSSPLYAVELAEQELNAEMVVLSACETGSGSDHLSEGTLGLTHAFTAAGARSVISSRWSVDDAATAELMNYFYNHVNEGLEKDESLRRAQQDYRLQHAGTYRDHPYYWSAFVFSGNATPVTFQPSASEFPFKWLLVGSVIIIGGMFAWRNKRAA